MDLEEVLQDVKWSVRKSLRRMVWEAVCVSMVIFVPTFVPVLVVVASLLLLLSPYTFWLVLLLLAWGYYDRHTPSTGGRIPWNFRGSAYARGVLGYYPLRVVRAPGCVLDPNKNYILDIHPHGIVQVATFAAFYLSEKVQASFPEMTFRFVAADFLVQMPILRELAMRAGAISCSERGMRYALQHPGRGVVLAMTSGSAEESMLLATDSYNFYLKRRGFCRIALAEGALLVPVLIFGKIHAYKQPLQSVQRWIFRKTGLRIILPFGRGILQKYLGPLPHRVPHTVVLGAPLTVQKTNNPSKEQIGALHKKYTQKLKQLYEEYSVKLNCTHYKLNIET